ncbi:MAG: FAD-dependent oxidoreductase [Pseudomonadota bacterium]
MNEAGRVLVVGAGPVGLVMALGLAQQGIAVTVIEAEPFLTHDLRAGTFHPPTLEMMAPLGITSKLLAIGIECRQWQIRDRKAGILAQFDLGLIADATSYPYRLHCEQHKLTPVVYELLKGLPGAEIRFSTRFISATQTAAEAIALVETKDGPDEIRAAYIVGADGGKSAVRKSMAVEFEGFTWPERFLVVSMTHDLEPLGYTYNAYIADPEEWCAIFKMPHLGPPGIWRVVFPTDPSIPEQDVLSQRFVEERLKGFLPDRRHFDVPYKSTYRVHQRVATDFRDGRLILAGDAAHLNNPLGAMGLNSGIHDAANLIGKLGAVIRGEADQGALDHYVRQRRQTNIEYVQAMSIRNKQLLEERDPKIRSSRLDEIRRIGADRKLARDFLIDSSMIASVKRANSIA